MDTKKKLYPNCDATVWIRSCKEEIVEPMLGKVSGIYSYLLLLILINLKLNLQGQFQIG